MLKVAVLSNQTLADITIQEKGSISAWFEVAISNSKGITQEIATGDILTIEGVPLDIEIVSFYRSKVIKPATWVKSESKKDNACDICKYFK
ncbi:hypothetical protein [Tenacibaculum maritimum]|uniref:hypothetical protein n=2 Tax=Tenacibaculum maritimum TaxID=107401 RepID=UPI0012E650C5|nr:hypothetical protein [Tenacibaculum maritimum]CAA0253540.1 hypothetical protein TMP445_80007 [Tenacibaculum maritimum]